MLLLEDKRYYVYIYLDPRKPGNYVYGDYSFGFEPIYVGKGSSFRKEMHLYHAKKNNLYSAIIKRVKNIIDEKETPIMDFLKQNLNENDAFDFEIKMIAIIGRKDENKGPLENRTKGGDGIRSCKRTHEDYVKAMEKTLLIHPDYKKHLSESLIGRSVSEHTREKLSVALTGKKHSDQTKSKISVSKKKYYKEHGMRKPTTETRQKMSKAAKCRKMSEEARKNMSIRRKGKKLNLSEQGREKLRTRYRLIHMKSWVIICPDMSEIIINDLPKWCIENEIKYKQFIKKSTRGKKWKSFKGFILKCSIEKK